MSNESKPTTRSAAVAAGYLFDKVTRMKAEEAGVVEAARLKFRARIAKLVAKAPADVQAKFFAMSAPSGTGETE